MTKNEENTVLIEVKFVSQLLAVKLQKVVKFVHYCEQDRTLLKSATKHVKTCTQ